MAAVADFGLSRALAFGQVCLTRLSSWRASQGFCHRRAMIYVLDHMHRHAVALLNGMQQYWQATAQCA